MSRSVTACVILDVKLNDAMDTSSAVTRDAEAGHKFEVRMRDSIPRFVSMRRMLRWIPNANVNAQLRS